MTDKLNGQFLINLNQKQRFINAVSEILEGDFHPSNIKLNLVGDYSKSVECGGLDSAVLYDVMHEKEDMRRAMFLHMIKPFWATYDAEKTKLSKDEKFLIFLKIMRECANVYPTDTLSEIIYAMQVALDINEDEAYWLQNGKMWHDYYLGDYEPYALAKLKKGSKGFYW